MDRLSNHPSFADAFRRLADISLNPRRHTAAHAQHHAQLVAAHAVALGRANQCSEAELRLLEDLALAHDLGKITGTARPEASLDVLRDCGIDDPALLALVKWHDTNLPWYVAATKGQPPSDKAWRRLAAALDLRLLAIFMVADRVDAPPGWRRNAPTAWFLQHARERGLVGDLTLDVPDHPGEVSAGCALVRVHEGARELLVIRVRAEGYELPKGGIEWDELPTEAAARETREEAGISSELVVGRELGHLDYLAGADQHRKRVRYFAARVDGPVDFGPLPDRTRERRWLPLADLAALPLVNDALRPVLRDALEGGDAGS